MEDQVISFRQIYDLFRRNMVVFALLVGLGAGLAFVAVDYIPTQYKSKSTISIQATYFRNPLVSDLISEVHDPRELSAQRSSLIQYAISDNFLDVLGEQYKLFESEENTPERAFEREKLRKNIEYYSMGPSSFEVNTIAPTAKAAAEINTLVHAQIRTTLFSLRINTLENTKEALEQHVRSLSKALVEKPKPKSERAIALKNELETLKFEIQSQLQHFTERHPSIQKLRLQEDDLERKISFLPKVNTEEKASNIDEQESVFLNSSAKTSVKDIHSDLVKKLSNLDLVLAIEKDQLGNPSYFSVIQQPTVPLSAFYPSKKKFALFGALLGALLGAFLVVFRELGREEELDMDTIFETTDLPLLGEIPFSNDENFAELRLLTQSPGSSVKRQLPRESLLKIGHA